MRAHLVQADIRWQDKAGNRETASRLALSAHVRPGDLVLLPEMFDTGFSMNVSETADSDGATLEWMTGLARRLRSYVQGGRTVLHDAGPKASNVMTVVGPEGSVVAEYAKVHPFTLGREHEHFIPGSEVTTWDWSGLRVAPVICYDLRFPELFRAGLAAGAELFTLGACWPEARQHHWRALLIARAIENQALVLGVNRVGSDPRAFGGLRYLGGSIAVSPTGEILGELGPDESVLTVDVDPAAVRAWREKFPAWKDRRM